MALALILAMYFGENRRGARNYGDLIVAGLFFLVPFLLIAQAAGPRHGGHADSGLLRHRVPGRACACGSSPIVAIAAVLLAPVAWKFALKDYQKSRIITFLDPEQDARGARLPADPGPDHRRLRRPEGQRVHEGHAGAVQVPAGRPQRLHLLGPRGGAGLHRRARRAGALSVRDSQIARSGPARQGPHRRVSGGRHHLGFRVPGDLQRHDVGRPGAR